ncbi:hypothetical protein GCM10025859_23650 [Alicyclobacillus fastidiosus]|nr:hypothetical protein GCM10025859_23650 [Alicyclobacillus fastidiosus]
MLFPSEILGGRYEGERLQGADNRFIAGIICAVRKKSVIYYEPEQIYVRQPVEPRPNTGRTFINDRIFKIGNCFGVL